MAVGAVEPSTGQRHILADAAGQARQVPAAADVGEQADYGFGHGEARIFGRDRKSQGSAMPTPPPIVIPSIIAIVGLG